MELTYQGITKHFKDCKAVDDFTLTLTPGIYGLLGANGSGKSTLMNMTCGLLIQTTGSISFNGQPTNQLKEKYLENIGYLPQRFGYYQEFTVHDFLRYMGLIKGIRGSHLNARIKEVLEIVGLNGMDKRKMHTLSGGMKQRVGIAQAIINDPQILILDEPTVGLDPQERVNFRNLIANLAGQRIVLLSTHIVSDVEYIADRIVIMKEGRILLNCSTKNATDVVKEKVWLCTVDQAEYASLNSFVIANIHYVNNDIQLRIISDAQPLPQARLTEPILEDVYLYYFNERSEELPI